MSINIEQIAERLCTAGRINMITSGLLCADKNVPFNKLPEKVQLHWLAVAEEAVRCRAESFAGIFTKPIPEGAVKSISQTQLEAFRAQMQEANDAEYGIPVVRELPRNGQLVDARYDGVYDWRRVTFWVDGLKTPHFGTIDAADGKGSQPATHWRPVEVCSQAEAAGPNPDYDWLEEAEAAVTGIWRETATQETCKKYLTRLLANWMCASAQLSRNEQYYRNIVVRIGELFAASHICDDGSLSEDVLCAKVFELVKMQSEVVADYRQQIRSLEQENAELRALGITFPLGTYEDALNCMKCGAAVRRKAWPQGYCLTIHRGVSPEEKDHHDHIVGVVERSPHFDLHLPDSYQAWTPSAADQLSTDWEIVKHD